ncbi:MAG: hypothetical protein B7Z40_08670 [Bosea sp. 12-68-7]|nr:MAG: hypothetical protein B7Z40_08670 [Bosea sp. 12-68-7]
MDLLVLLLGTLVGGIAFLFTPWGVPLAAMAFSALRESKVLQWLAFAAVAVIGILALRRDARKAGQREALADVEAANRKAMDRRVEIDRETERAAEQTIRDELKRWSR